MPKPRRIDADTREVENYTFVMDKEMKAELLKFCEEQDMYVAQAVRRAIRRFLDQMSGLT